MEHELLFLGTCAADFSPRLKGDCRDRFDPDARRSSAALLDGRYLIDCGPHTPDALAIAEADAGAITDLFLTHTHSDHFDPANIEALAALTRDGLRLWASAEAQLPGMKGVTVMRMEKFTPYAVNGELTVTGLKANHEKTTAPQWLLFTLGEKKLLYALDGAWYVNETYYFLRNAGLDLLVADATVGDYDGDYRVAEHNSIPMLRLLLPSLRTFGVVKEETRVFLSHLAPSLHRPHSETEKIAASFGALVARDGLRVSL